MEMQQFTIHPSLLEWPSNVPSTAKRIFSQGENPTDYWQAVEFYDDAGTLLSRSAHVMVKYGVSADLIKGDF